MTPDDPNRAEFDRRRKSRALVTALILGGLVALFAGDRAVVRRLLQLLARGFGLLPEFLLARGGLLHVGRAVGARLLQRLLQRLLRLLQRLPGTRRRLLAPLRFARLLLTLLLPLLRSLLRLTLLRLTLLRLTLLRLTLLRLTLLWLALLRLSRLLPLRRLAGLRLLPLRCLPLP